MKFLLPLLSLLFFTASCKIKPKEERQVKSEVTLSYNEQEANWMKKLAEWNVTRFNDSAKWRMYCFYGDDTCTKGIGNRQLVPIVKRTLNPMPLAFLDLKLSFAMFEGDTLALLYSFVYNDSTEVYYTQNRSKGYIDDTMPTFGLEFDVKADTVIAYEAGCAMFREYGPLSRYENFTHSALLSFVNQNSSRLNPWFRKEAIKRGIITL